MGISIPIKSTEEINRIKDLLRRKNQISELLMFTLAINTGLELKELLNLKVKDVRNKQYLKIDKVKVMPLSEDLIALIKEVASKRKGDEYLFQGASGEKFHRTTIFHFFKNICTELGFSDKYSVASWRKTFAYHDDMKYKDLSYLQWLFNQTNIKLALKYIDVDENMNLRYREGVCL